MTHLYQVSAQTTAHVAAYKSHLARCSSELSYINTTAGNMRRARRHAEDAIHYTKDAISEANKSATFTIVPMGR